MNYFVPNHVIDGSGDVACPCATTNVSQYNQPLHNWYITLLCMTSASITSVQWCWTYYENNNNSYYNKIILICIWSAKLVILEIENSVLYYCSSMCRCKSLIKISDNIYISSDCIKTKKNVTLTLYIKYWSLILNVMLNSVLIIL